MTKQLQVTLAALMVLSAIRVPAQTTTPAHTTTTAKKKKAVAKAPKETATERQIRELREQMQNQQAEIDNLKAQTAAKDAELAAAQQAATAAQATAAAATTQAQSVGASVQANADAVASLQGTVTDLKNSNTGLALTISDTKKDLTEKIESPTALHYKGILIQPGGFIAAETVYRSRSLNSDVNTPFNSTPYMNTAQAFTSEFNASGRQSRLAVLLTAPTPWGKMGGYYEMDFLGAGTTSNDNQTNSYVVRQREAWVQAAVNNGFTFTGGQMWSLATEVKKGINEAPGAENLPQTIDAQYHVGFTFERQYGARFAYNFAKIHNIAIAIEESQTVLAGTTNAPTNFFFGSAGNTGGLYNSTGNGSTAQNYSNNVAPDIIVKYSADTKFGHYEVGGIARFFRDRYYPSLGYTTTVVTTATKGTNYTVTGGGFFANARVPVKKYAEIGVHVLQGDGTGRYGTSNLGDVTVKPNGTLEPLRNSAGLVSVETHPAKKLDIFGYAGGEYLQRTVYTAFTAAAPTTPVYVGYAPIQGEKDGACNTEIPPTAASGYAPGASSCSGHTRAVLEGTAGFTYRLYSSPTKGRIQYSMTYSYLTREAWTGLNTAGTAAVNPKATNNMVFSSFRYYIP
ncbi:uncharacterized small protein (DUF1192 family) [Granulicella aggregans]|uniref:Uncharacterized small protein (DUF1192 family) n=1 Tax=Granulicella aggregans TaxID=474949 RepID=A0A7W8E5B4_9BACT|nr:hypothetical protein [Granulicella aggregans]MBB5059461.1 uncharacterized small protein (DUF1192 family) [Granulicella aggregans]